MTDTAPSPSAFAAAAALVRAGGSARTEAAAIVRAMTIDELLECVDGDLDAWPGLIDMAAGGYHEHPFPAAVVPRLGVPGFHFADGPRGCVVGDSTAFPVSMARGAAFDPDLERRIGRAVGLELHAVGATFYGGVCVNLLRHPGWGRAQETYGEDPLHVGELGAALAAGVQERGVMACVKHFALNSMENARFSVDVQADERALHEVYLPHFRRIVQAGVASVMSAYNSVNGEWCGDNRALLTGVLRDEWGFDGFVISDFIFGTRDAVGGVLAGLDVEMPFRQQRWMHLRAALDDGRITRHDLERCVERVVATLLRFAAAGDPDAAVSVPVVPWAEHRALAREAAVASMVLLCNDDVLPLDATALRRVAVLGELAAVANLGDRGSSDVPAARVVTPLDGIRRLLEEHRVEVVHAAADVTVVDDADVAVVVVGCTHRDEGEFMESSSTAHLMAEHFPPFTDADRAAVAAQEEARGRTRPPRGGAARREGFGAGGDRRSLRLSPAHEQLILDVADRHARVVVVLMGGSAIVTAPWRHRVQAVLHAWYPGVEGGTALAEVLLGREEPGGRLPFAEPGDESHLVAWDPDATRVVYDLWHGQWKLDHDGVAAAHPFGWGLGYTTWRLHDAELRHGQVMVTVTNTGTRDGSTVVQAFGGLPGSAWERPARRLVGFRRVRVAAGAAVRVAVDLHPEVLDVRVGDRWVTEAGAYRLEVGRWSGDPDAVVLGVDLPGAERSAYPATP